MFSRQKHTRPAADRNKRLHLNSDHKRWMSGENPAGRRPIRELQLSGIVVEREENVSSRGTTLYQ